MSRVDAQAVLPLLRGWLGKPYRYVESCPSTQRLLGEDDSEGTTVATDHQTEGRGRLGRRWEDAPGRAILMSVLLRPPAPTPLWPELSLVAGEAVAAALRAETGIDASLRHPNDVVIAGRKLAGVLPEASRDRVVLGIGVNVNQGSDELPAGPQTLTWDGKLAGGPRAPDGPYTLALVVTDDVGTFTRTATVTFDTVAPRVTVISYRKLLFRVSEPATLTLMVGTRRFTRSLTKPGTTQFWLKSKPAAYVLTATDAAGNATVVRYRR